MKALLTGIEAKASPLSEAIGQGLVSRKNLAIQLGCSGAAITNALRNGRRVHVVLHEDGTAEAFEISPFPGRK